MENNTQSLQATLSTFVADCQRKINEHFINSKFTFQPPTLTQMPGKKYVRIVSKDVSSRYAWCFIDTTNGDILKVASWTAPAKHARGNIYQPETWTTITSYGPAYLK